MRLGFWAINEYKMSTGGMFRGSMVALVTPMHGDGAIDEGSLQELVDFHVSNHTDAIITVGTTGESATLDEREHCPPGFYLILEAPPIKKLALQRGEEALAHRIVIGIADRSHGRPDAGLLASDAKGN